MTPEWAMVGRVPSVRSMARFTERSSTDLFHVGSCIDARALAPSCAVLRGSVKASASMSRRIGSL